MSARGFERPSVKSQARSSTLRSSPANGAVNHGDEMRGDMLDERGVQ